MKSLTNAFQSVIPEAPGTSDWGAAARRRSRNRRVMLSGVAAIATVVVLAVEVVGVQQLQGSSGINASRADQAGMSSGSENGDETVTADDEASLIPTVCADVLSGALPTSSIPDEGLPQGATKAWWCGEPGGRLGPPEPLLQGVEQLVSAINELPKVPAEEVFCTLEYTLTWHVIIEYPDGERRAIQAEEHGCRFVGETRWQGNLFGEAQKLWQAQRDSGAVSYTAEPDLCATYPNASQEQQDRKAGYESILDVKRSQATRGAVCGVSVDSSADDPQVVQHWLTPESVAAIREAKGDGTEVDQAYHDGAPYVVLLTEFGDPTTVYLDNTGKLLLDSGAWEPTEAEAPDLVEALSKLRG